jgi:hypothetical protein
MGANKGKRLYECDECKHRQYLHWTALQRHTKPRCAACGCTRLEVCSPEAKKELVEGRSRAIVRKSIDDAKKTPAR